jgi:hypothetical protein
MTLPYRVQVRRRDELDRWRDIAAFDSAVRANGYAWSCGRGSRVWKYRVVTPTTEVTNGRP